MLKLNEPYINQDIFAISFSIIQIWGWRVNFLFLQFFIDILRLGSGSVDPHIFADPDTGS